LDPFDTFEDSVCTLRRENYKVFASIGCSPLASTTVRAILDTGAGPNLVHADVLPRSALDSLRTGKLPTVRDASRRALTILGALPLYLRLGSLQVKVWFLVATNLAAQCILGTSFVDRYVRAIYPRLRKVTFHDAAPVGIVSASPGPDANTRQVGTLPKETQSNKLRVVRSVEIPARSQAEVWVQTSASGLSFLQGSPHLTTKQHSMMANGVMEVIPNVPFRVVLANLKESPLRLQKGSVVGLALPAPAGLAHLPQADGLADRDAIATVETDATSTAPEEENPATWQEKLQIGDDFEGYRHRIVEMLSAFEDM